MLGLTLAPMTGRQVADLIQGADLPEAEALAPDRFRRSLIAR
jgi:glycine/D-amino acid oxidase-like deaminating enzyme